MTAHAKASMLVEQATVLSFTGEQACWFLDQLVTNKVDDLGSSAAAESLLLTPKGRIVSHLHIINAGDHVLMRAAPDPSLMAFFQGKVFSTRVEISDVTAAWASIGLMGECNEVIREAGLPLPAPDAMSVSMSEEIVAFRYPGLQGVCLLVPSERRQETLDLLERCGASPPSSVEDAYASAGAARFGIDFGPENLPQEAAMERAVHFQKGCYLGQEAVAMTQRGRAKRRLRHLELTGGPAQAEEVISDGRSVGSVTTMGRRCAVAMLSTEVEEGETVTVGGVEGVVHDLPGTDRGPGRPSARELRERLTSG